MAVKSRISANRFDIDFKLYARNDSVLLVTVCVGLLMRTGEMFLYLRQDFLNLTL